MSTSMNKIFRGLKNGLLIYMLENVFHKFATMHCVYVNVVASSHKMER